MYIRYLDVAKKNQLFFSLRPNDQWFPRDDRGNDLFCFSSTERKVYLTFFPFLSLSLFFLSLREMWWIIRHAHSRLFLRWWNQIGESFEWTRERQSEELTRLANLSNALRFLFFLPLFFSFAFEDEHAWRGIRHHNNRTHDKWQFCFSRRPLGAERRWSEKMKCEHRRSPSSREIGHRKARCLD